jgi:hypothetical protein
MGASAHSSHYGSRLANQHVLAKIIQSDSVIPPF